MIDQCCELKYVPFNNVLMKSFNNTEQKSMETYLNVSRTIENRGAVA